MEALSWLERAIWRGAARTSLIAVDSNHAITTIPGKVRELLAPVPDPIRL